VYDHDAATVNRSALGRTAPAPCDRAASAARWMSPRSPCVCSSRGRSVPITRRARHPPRRERTRAWWPA